MFFNNQANGFDVLLCEMQIEFNNALKIKDYRAMSEIMTEAQRIKNEHIGNYISELSKKTYFAELSSENTIALPPEGIKALDITLDTLLLVYMDVKNKYIVVDTDTYLSPSDVKGAAEGIKLAENAKINLNGELLICTPMLQSMDAAAGDIFLIEVDDDDMMIKKYDNDFLWEMR